MHSTLFISKNPKYHQSGYWGAGFCRTLWAGFTPVGTLGIDALYPGCLGAASVVDLAFIDVHANKSISGETWKNATKQVSTRMSVTIIFYPNIVISKNKIPDNLKRFHRVSWYILQKVYLNILTLKIENYIKPSWSGDKKFSFQFSSWECN